MDDTTPRKGQYQGRLDREEFRRRFLARFYDPAFDAEREALERIEAIAYEAYDGGRKAPRDEPAGEGFADPKRRLSVEWLATRKRLIDAQRRQSDATSPARVLVINASSRNDGTCPGEVSKSWRLAGIAQEVLAGDREFPCEVDTLDLSLVTSEYGRAIHPCKGCVSTAMPLCHWPCSCYPNHSLGQVHDWMAEIYERWVAAHGVLIVTPVYWTQMPSPLKAMVDRMVCADGGNPDPTTTDGKDAERAKRVELAGWAYPKHLKGRIYGVVVHGDTAGIEGTRRALTEWLDAMELIDAGSMARLERYVGYYEPYATSHAALDRDTMFQEEVRNAARAVVRAVYSRRRGTLEHGDEALHDARPK
ncbi:MAG: flavodoxin family protein [Deltaproteobacteria bacterium]|nr:flavodoxin family protein [Myxococcales bacterium]MDP3213426.1 flavodoxin family protein [Deltaproteobacteria bacterium]